MASFHEAIEVVLKHEGGYTVDHAGPTNYGITAPTLARFLNTHPDNITPALIRNLTRTQASEIYRRLWWVPYRYAEIDHQAVATKVFDLAVNMGPRRAHRFLQSSVNAQLTHRLAVDGIIGPLTIDAVNACESRKLLQSLRNHAETFYCKLVQRNPDKYGKFLNGWLKRARA